MNQYQTITDFSLAKNILKHLQTVSMFSFDVEATALDINTEYLLGVGFSWQVKTGVYIPFRKRDRGIFVSQLENFWDEHQIEELTIFIQELFTKSKAVKAAHNAGFDLLWLSDQFKIPIKDIHNVYCTQFNEYIQHPYTGPDADKRFKLATLVKDRYPDLADYKDTFTKVKTNDMSEVRSTEEIGEYCAKDCDACLRLAYQQIADSQDAPYRELFPTRLMPAVKLVARMKQRGFRIDMDYLSDTKIDLRSQKKTLLDNIQEQISDLNFNPASDKDLQNLFFRKMDLQPINDMHLDDAVLTAYYEKYDIGIAQDILDYRKVAKLLSTYFEGIEKQVNPKTHRLYADFRLWGAKTGRLSCRNPNLQNLPTRAGPIVKRMFIPSEGYRLAGGDYSQIELRIIAWLCKDPLLLDAYRRGIDLHALTASILFGVSVDKVTPYQRYLGKQCNFALCYDGSASTLVDSIGYKLMGPEAGPKDFSDEQIFRKAKFLRGKYFAKDTGYFGILGWGEDVIRQTRKDGYVTSMYGRILYLPDIRSSNDRARAHAERQAVNMNPQSTGADYLLFRFCDCQDEFDRLGVDVYPLINIHDFMGFEIPIGFDDEFCKIVSDIGTRKDEADIGVPMVIKPVVGNNLSEVA